MSACRRSDRRWSSTGGWSTPPPHLLCSKAQNSRCHRSISSSPAQSTPDPPSPPADRPRRPGSGCARRNAPPPLRRNRRRCRARRAVSPGGRSEARRGLHPSAPRECCRAWCARRWSHPSHEPRRRSAARSGNCPQCRTATHPPRLAPARPPHCLGSRQASCRRNTGRAEGRSYPSPPAHGLPPSDGRKGQRCAGPARRWRCRRGRRWPCPRPRWFRADW